VAILKRTQVTKGEASIFNWVFAGTERHSIY
jgi:hypothetical protein